MNTINISVLAGGTVQTSKTALGRSGEHLITRLHVTPDEFFASGADFFRISFGDDFSERLYLENGSFDYSVPEWALRPPAVDCQIHAFTVVDGEIVVVERSKVFTMEVEYSPSIARILPQSRADDIETELARCGATVAAAESVADRAAAAAEALDAAVETAGGYSALASTDRAAAEAAAEAAAASAGDALSHKNGAETAKAAAETAVSDALSHKSGAESAKSAAEAAAGNALSCKNDAETAKTAAETAVSDALSHKNAAQTAKAAAEQAASDALSCKNGAETAKSAAEQAAQRLDNELGSSFSDIFSANAGGSTAVLQGRVGRNVRSVTIEGDYPAVTPSVVISASKNIAFPSADKLTDNGTSCTVVGGEISVSTENSVNAYAALDIAPPHVGDAYSVTASWKDELLPGNACVMVFLSSTRGQLLGSYSLAGAITQSGNSVTVTPDAALPFIVLGLYVVNAGTNPVSNSAVFYNIAVNHGSAALYSQPTEPSEYPVSCLPLNDGDSFTLTVPVAAGDVIWADFGDVSVDYYRDKVSSLDGETVKHDDIASDTQAGIVRAVSLGNDKVYPAAVDGNGSLYSSAGYYETVFTVDTPAWTNQPTVVSGHFVLPGLNTGSGILAENSCVSFIGTPPTGLSAENDVAYSVHIVDAENGVFDLMETENDNSTVSVVTLSDGGGDWSMRDGGIALYDYVPKGDSGRFEFKMAGRIKRTTQPTDFHDNSYANLYVNPTTLALSGRLSGWFFGYINNRRYQNRMYVAPSITHYTQKIRELAVRAFMDISRDYAVSSGSYLCKTFELNSPTSGSLNNSHTTESEEKPSYFRLTSTGTVDRIRFEIGNHVMVNGTVISVKEER